MQEAYVLNMEHISKIYGNGIVANEDVNFNLKRGEIHALVGENGAGKTTLMKILFGMEKPSSGTITLEGAPLEMSSSEDAISHGIGMVHQHFMLVDVFSAIENIGLMGDAGTFSITNRKKIEENLEHLKEKYGIDVDLHSPVEQLSIGMQQKVEILKLLYTGADLLIFDEPTAVLLPQECDGLFEIIWSARAKG